MSGLEGQITSPLPGGGLALSGARVVEDGARVGLLLADGLFRFDVQPLEDTLRVVVRNLTDGELEWHERETEQKGCFAFDVHVDGRHAVVQVVSSRVGPDDSQWQLTAQAKLSPA